MKPRNNLDSSLVRQRKYPLQRFNELRFRTMPELKQLHKDAIPAALEKAEHYRLLNEPGEAESICLDILAVDPDNQRPSSRFCSHLPIGSKKGMALVRRKRKNC